MRTAAFAASFLLTFTACSTTEKRPTESPFTQPNDLMAGEITRRVEEIPFLHREELLDNLLWLGQTGEQAIPALLKGLRHDHAKVRSSAAWVLGRLRDRRTIPALQAAVKDTEPTVQLECARTLVLLGDLVHAPVLIEGLDSDRKEVRYLCHEALKTSTGHDFGYDHLAVNQADMRGSVLRWRQWWSEYSGDAMFAASYQRQYGVVDQPAAPAGEIKLDAPEGQQDPENNEPPTVEPPANENEVPVLEIEGEATPVPPIGTESVKPVVKPVVKPGGNQDPGGQ